MVPSPLAVVVVVDAAVGHHHHHAPFRRVPLVAPLRRRRGRGRVRGGVGRRRRALHRGSRGRQVRHGRGVVDRRRLSPVVATAAVRRRFRLEMLEPLIVVDEWGRCPERPCVPGVRGQVSLEALPPRVHVRAEVAGVPRRVELSRVSLKLVVVPVGLSATNLKQDDHVIPTNRLACA